MRDRPASKRHIHAFTYKVCARGGVATHICTHHLGKECTWLCHANIENLHKAEIIYASLIGICIIIHKEEPSRYVPRDKNSEIR